MICAVGLNCLDIVSFVKKFPKEDEDIRCTKQIWARGGNASNNATVLVCLGQPVEFFGTFANDHLLRFFTEDMAKLGIKYDNCPLLDGNVQSPASVVICSEETGTRTIVHSKGDLRELYWMEFKNRIDLKKYDWIHFEGRNEEEVVKMIKHISITLGEVDEGNYKTAKIPISIEVEKCRETLQELFPFAHVLFVGKDYAQWKGAKDCTTAVEMFLKTVRKGTLVICPWGEHGAAYGISGEIETKKVDAFPPTQIIDSLGAGDTFVATTIFCLKKGMDIEASVRMGCRVASKKLEMFGFLGLKEKAGLILPSPGAE